MSSGGSPFLGRRVDKPWGYELIWAETDRYAGKTLHIEAAEVLSFQYHVRKDETIHLLEGSLEVERQMAGEERQSFRMTPGESLHIPAGCRHRLRAVERCVVLEVSTPELDDVVRLEDNYGRVGRVK